MVSNLDYIIVLAYLGYLIWIGIKSAGKIKNQEDFLVAGNRLNYSLYVPSMAAVMIGGGVTFGTVGLSYQYGISGIWLGGMFGIGFFAFGILLPKKLSQLKVFSVSELLGNKYGDSSRFLSGAVMIIYDLMIAVNAIIGTGVILATLFKFNLSTGIIIGGLVVVLYTVLGGMWAVTLTDVVQYWILMIGIVLLLMPFGIQHVGGFSALTNKVDPSFLSFTSIGTKQIISFLFLYLFGVMIGQDVWQRAFTAKNKTVMQKGAFLAGFSCVIYAIACALIGITASIVLPSLDDPQDALSELIQTILPVGLSGLTIAAILAALMSSASGTLLASSTVMVNDYVMPISKLVFNKEYHNKQIIGVTRIVTVLLSIVALFIALYLKSILAALDLAYALLSGGIFLPVMAALFWKRVSAKTALFSMIGSSALVVIGIIIEGLSSYNPIIYGLIGGGVIMLAGIFISKPNDHAKGDYTEVKS